MHAGKDVIRMLQRSFPEELKILKSKWNEHTDASHQNLQLDNKLIFLDPFIKTEEILCVGDRLNKISLNKDLIHPLLLLKNETVTNMIIRWSH